MMLRAVIRTGATALTVAIALLPGCTSIAPAGPLRAQSTGSEAVMLMLGKSEAIYETAKQAESSFIVSTVPIKDLINGDVTTGQVVHFELLWIPKGGETPLSPSATNISIRHVVFADGQVGVYEGAGFAIPDGEVGGKTVSITLHSATIRLAHATPGFVDRLGEAEMAGSFKASLAPGKTSAANFALSQLVTDALGESLYVRRARDDVGTVLAHDNYLDKEFEYFEADLNVLLARLERAGVTTP